MTKSGSITGTIRRLGLEGGVWSLVADDGSVIELLDPPAALRVDGLRVTVVLDRDGADVTIGMLGDAGSVKSFRIV